MQSSNYESIRHFGAGLELSRFVAHLLLALEYQSDNFSKAVSMLSEQELVIAARGRGGGIRLSIDPKDLCIGDLVRQTENLSLVECFNLETNTCPIASDCTLERLLQDATKAFLAVLDKMTLADLLPASQALLQIRLAR